MVEFKYRPDVDGLRAIAVILVLLFHAGLGFSGGYIGVDVFFVISGFLITGLILKAQDAGTFSLTNFWDRRIRRIIPAATVMVASVLVAGFFLLLPQDYKDLGQSTIAQQFMLSNVYFWRNTGYFDGPADLKPLLHTWSLAVEEQFYLGYPFLLLLLHRFGRKGMFVTLLLLAAVSLGASVYGVAHHPSATFFLLPTRAWELLAGALICFLPMPTKVPAWLLSTISWMSLAAILLAGWFYTPSTPFPGLSAMIPCGAAAALIYANSSRLSLAGAILATKPLVFVGLVSYSLYLWHWPIFAFSRYWLGHTLSDSYALGALAVSVVFGVASWKYIETPFRRGARTSRPRVTVLSAVCSATIVVGMALWARTSNGFVAHLPEHIQTVAEPFEPSTHMAVERKEIQQGQLPSLGIPNRGNGPPDFLVWGDSHAMAFGACFDSIAQEHGLSGVIAARSGTVPVLGVWRPLDSRGAGEAIDWKEAVLEFARKSKVRNIILVARWAVYIEGRQNGATDTLIASHGAAGGNVDDARAAFDTGLAGTLDELEAMGVNVWILKQVPLQRFNAQRAIVRSLYWGQEIPRGTSIVEHTERQRHANAIIDRNVEGRKHVNAVDLSTGFFPDRNESIIGDDTGAYYRDRDHISNHGALTVCRPVIDSILSKVAHARNEE